MTRLVLRISLNYPKTMKYHNGPYIAACADKLGRELTKDELIHALDCLAHEALQTVEKYQTALKGVVDMTARYSESSLSFGVVNKVATEVLDSQNVKSAATGSERKDHE
jgi:hypothetical protein